MLDWTCLTQLIYRKQNYGKNFENVQKLTFKSRFVRRFIFLFHRIFLGAVILPIYFCYKLSDLFIGFLNRFVEKV